MFSAKGEGRQNERKHSFPPNNGFFVTQTSNQSLAPSPKVATSYSTRTAKNEKWPCRPRNRTLLYVLTTGRPYVRQNNAARGYKILRPWPAVFDQDFQSIKGFRWVLDDGEQTTPHHGNTAVVGPLQERAHPASLQHTLYLGTPTRTHYPEKT